MAPELHNIIAQIYWGKLKEVDTNYDVEKADIFSLGLILLDLFVLDKINGQDYWNITINLMKMQKTYPILYNIVKKMVNENPYNRKSFSTLNLLISNNKEAINNTCFSEIDFINSQKFSINNEENY